MTHSWSVHPELDAIEHRPGEDCICGPTAVPLPTASGDIWWLHLHHGLTAGEIRPTYVDEMREWAAQQGESA